MFYARLCYADNIATLFVGLNERKIIGFLFNIQKIRSNKRNITMTKKKMLLASGIQIPGGDIDKNFALGYHCNRHGCNEQNIPFQYAENRFYIGQ